MSAGPNEAAPAVCCGRARSGWSGAGPGNTRSTMAPDRLQGAERPRFPALVAVGAALGAVIVVVAFVSDASLAWPLLILFAICLAAAIVLRRIAGSRRDEADHTDTFPRQPPRPDRPLGDTPEAHDEISPHDIPVGSPSRRAAEDLAGGPGGTTRGHRQGGAAGLGGSAADDRREVGPDEKDGARI
jgi:hypothetical protein